MGKLTDQIKIAKINAWQAVLVALIGALAGVAGTAGFKYIDSTKAVSEKSKEIEKLERKIADYQRVLNTGPVTVLRVARVGIEHAECLKRLTDWHRAGSRTRQGPASSMQSTSYDQNFISSFERFTVRVACPAGGDVVAVSVSIQVSLSEDLDRALELANKVTAVLQ